MTVHIWKHLLFQYVSVCVYTGYGQEKQNIISFVTLQPNKGSITIASNKSQTL